MATMYPQYVQFYDNSTASTTNQWTTWGGSGYPVVSNGNTFRVTYPVPMGSAPIAEEKPVPEDNLAWLRRRVTEVCEEAFAA